MWITTNKITCYVGGQAYLPDLKYIYITNIKTYTSYTQNKNKITCIPIYNLLYIQKTEKKYAQNKIFALYEDGYCSYDSVICVVQHRHTTLSYNHKRATIMYSDA